MRKSRKAKAKQRNKAVWSITVAVFLACCALAVFFGCSQMGKDPSDEAMQSAEAGDNLNNSVETGFEVVTKAPNTGKPVMTTVINEIVVTEEDSTSEEESIENIADESSEVTLTVPEESTEWYLLLVNPWNYLPDDFTPDLVSVSNGQQADRRVKDALEAMLADCRKAGYNPYICSSYRTLSHQTANYNNQINKYLSSGYDRATAEIEAAKWVAVPGTSEHHTGFAFDIVSASYQALDHSQANTPEQKWLMANCYKYGFILRYPDGKTDITGIYYEPWHYRYVGVEVATEITEKQITLEEYLGRVE
ncbi:MAG: M15 family metallopeptidase [Clostridia bacterium]|nr:M15 family metallopeptidase [Clostridia bacterium]